MLKLTRLLVLAVAVAACGGLRRHGRLPDADILSRDDDHLDRPAARRAGAASRLRRVCASELVEKKAKSRGGAEVIDVVYTAGARKVSAYLARPKGKPRAALLWAHWYGEEANTNRTEFLPDAVALANAESCPSCPRATSPGKRT